MKKGVILINTSRGELVDENAIMNGIERNIISCLGLDVLNGEPNIEENKFLK